MAKAKKVLSVFSLVAINVIAVDSLRSFAISAEYGLTLIFYYILGALFFMIPVALCAAEMASTWPEEGGIYVWAKRAFGVRTATMAAWFQWIYNIIWYPTVLSFLVSTLLFIFSPALALDKHVVILISFVLFWLATGVNFFGMKASAGLSKLGAVVGTLFPIAIIIVLTVVWFILKKPIAMDFHTAKFLPDMTNLNHLAILSGMLFGLVGIEMSAIHAKDVENPQKNYPKAIAISVLIILSTAVLSSLAIAFVIPQADLNLSTGLIKTFSIYLDGFGLSWALPVVVICILVGGFSSISAWVIGPSKCMFRACEDGSFPKMFARKNSFNAPANMLWLQGFVFTLLCLVFWFFPGFNQSYWLLSDMTAQVSVIFYAMLFIVMLRLRYKFPDVVRPFRVPGGNPFLWLIALLGLITCVFVFSFGMLPPPQLNILSPVAFESVLIGGIVLTCLGPFIISGLMKLFDR